MSTILYNANSTLVSRFQRKIKSAGEIQHELEEDPRFESLFPLDSREYLQELCCSIYTESLMNRINNLSSTKLAMHAFCALLIKNFVKSWYGTKIATSDLELIQELFDLIEQVSNYLTKTIIDWEQLVCDDIPFVLTQHVNIMRHVMEEDLTYEKFLDLYLYEGEYPNVISDRILEPLVSKSMLQKTFLNELFRSLLFERVVESLMDPSVLMDIITKFAKSINDKSERQPRLSLFSYISKLKGKILGAVQYFSKLEKVIISSSDEMVPFSHRYIFSFLKTIFRLNSRRPLLYTILKYMQCFAANQPAINTFLRSTFHNVLSSKILASNTITEGFCKLRHILFPKDNKFNPGRKILSEDELIALKTQCEENLTRILKHHSLFTVLAISQRDIHEFIEALNRDKRMNTLLLYKIIETIVAHAT